jgi:protease I
MSTTGKRVAVLLEDLYHDVELWYTVYRLREAAVTAPLVGTGTKDVYSSKHGGQAFPDLDIGKIRAEEFDGVVITGGFAPDHLRRHRPVLDFVRALFEAGDVVASICHGPWVLCSAGILRGKRCTGYASVRDDVVNAGASWCDQPVCVDGNVITARCPDDLPAFLPAVIRALDQRREAPGR